MKLEYIPYGSPDCPLIRLYDFTPAEAEQLRVAVVKLASGESPRVQVHRLPFVESIRGCRLSLCLRSWFQSTIKISEPADFECGFPAEVWDDIAGFIEPFAQGSGGFQWLAGAPGEATLLLSVDGKW